MRVEADQQQAREYDMNEFLPEKDRGECGNEVAKGKLDPSKALRFVIVTKEKEDTEAEWTVASVDHTNDMINDILMYLHQTDKDTAKAYAWTNARKGIVGLHPQSRERIEKFRTAIRDWVPDESDEEEGEIKAIEFESYLLDALVEKYSLTILLKRNMRKINIDSLTGMIFDRNRTLRGT